MNFFQPLQKLVHKERVSSKVHKDYDQVQTPHQRVLASAEVDKSVKVRLRQVSSTLPLVALRRRIDHN